MKVRFCENNEGSGKIFKRLRQEFPEANLKRKSCIKNCALCKKTLVALVDGEAVRASDSEELYSKIAAALKRS